MCRLKTSALMAVMFIAGCGQDAVFEDAGADVPTDVPVLVDVADAAVDTVPDSGGRDSSAGDDAADDLAAADSVADDHVLDDVSVDSGVTDTGVDAAVENCLSAWSPTILGTLDSSPLNEVSGLAASRLHPGVLWAHNDSGDGARIFAIQLPQEYPAEPGPLSVVEFLVRQAIPGRRGDAPVDATDWEDIAIGPLAGLDGDAIFVADTGDNSFLDPANRRDYLAVVIIPEPADIAAGTVRAERRMKFVYDDGPHDSEAFFVDPWTGDMFIIEKRHDGDTAGVYHVAAAALARATDELPVVAHRIATIDIALATGADMSADGTLLAIRNYGGAPDGVVNNGLLYSRTPGMSVEQMLAAPPCPLPNYAADPWFEIQGEAIAVKPDGSGFYTSHERVINPQNLRFWPLHD